MIHITQAIVVEGKYDKIKLSALTDAPLVVTNGFHIFHDSEKLALIRYYAKTIGVVLLLDSDAAGFKIRGFLKGAVTDGKIYNAYIPDVFGKERRKEKSGAEGKLGVEGLDKDTLVRALGTAGLTPEDKPPNPDPIVPYDLYILEITGHADSRHRREMLERKLDLPLHLSTQDLIDVLNARLSREELVTLMREL